MKIFDPRPLSESLTVNCHQHASKNYIYNLLVEVAQSDDFAFLTFSEINKYIRLIVIDF